MQTSGTHTTHTTHTAGTTSATGEGIGDKITRKAGEAWQGVKEATPGTQEHRATHPTAGTAGTGLGAGTGMAAGMGAPTGGYNTTGTGYGSSGMGHTTMGATSGEPMGQKISRKAGEAWEDIKEATPGTQEHRATHPQAGTGASTMTGMTGATTEEYHHASSRHTNI